MLGNDCESRDYKSGGEGGIRTPGRSFSPYNGLANCPIPPPDVRNQLLTFGCEALIRAKKLLFGSNCATIVQPEKLQRHHSNSIFAHELHVRATLEMIQEIGTCAEN